MTFFKIFWQNTSKYHLHKFRNYFKEWVLTENLTIEGSTELKDFLLSDIIYPTVQKWFYSKCRRIHLWPCHDKFDPFWTYLVHKIHFEHVCSSLIKFEPIYSLNMFVQVQTNLVYLDPISSSLIKFKPIYSILIQFDQVWTCLCLCKFANWYTGTYLNSIFLSQNFTRSFCPLFTNAYSAP